MLAYPFATNLYQSRLQDRLERELASDDLRAKWTQGRLGEGDALTRLRIPATDVDVVVVEGTSSSALRAGAGHYPATPLPGEDGNVAIAGHRTTYGRPFHSNDKLRKGNRIFLETPVGSFEYEIVREPYVVEASNWTPIRNTPGQKTLTLTTCHPKGSAKQRLVVKAVLVDAT
jgi:sortase A